jgi:hypothetical protein
LETRLIVYGLCDPLTRAILSGINIPGKVPGIDNMFSLPISLVFPATLSTIFITASAHTGILVRTLLR